MTIQVRTLVGAYLCTETAPTFGLRVHFVDKEKRCTCGQARCRHVKAVAEYLKGGGGQAPKARLAEASESPSPASVPAACPICGCVVQYEAGSAVWRCVADRSHYWQWRGEQGGVAAFLTGRHPAKAGAFYEQSVEEREIFLVQAYQQLLQHRRAVYV
jgi:hypothetical protein